MRKDPSSKPGESPEEKEAAGFLAIARILRPQGRRGEVLAELLTDFPYRFRGVGHVYVEEPGQRPREYTLEYSWPHKGRIVLKFSGISAMDAAERLRGFYVLVPVRERVALPGHSYYWSELYGCRVVAQMDGAEKEVGIVTAVEPTAGVALLHIASTLPGCEEILVPFAQEICKSVDTAGKEIVIDPPEDLLELNTSAKK